MRLKWKWCLSIFTANLIRNQSEPISALILYFSEKKIKYKKNRILNFLKYSLLWAYVLSHGFEQCWFKANISRYFKLFGPIKHKIPPTHSVVRHKKSQFVAVYDLVALLEHTSFKVLRIVMLSVFWWVFCSLSQNLSGT